MKQLKAIGSAIVLRLHARRRSLALLGLGVATLLVGTGLWAGWRQQLNEQVTCHLAVSKEGFKGYFEIALKEQHPTEPTFEGKYFALTKDWEGEAPKTLTVFRSPSRSYATHSYRTDLVVDRDGDLRPPERRDFALVTEQGTHRFFPFDLGRFDFDLRLEPALNIDHFRIVNRVPGFMMDCKTLRVDRIATGKFHVSFEIARNPLTKLTAVVLMAASAVFLVLMMGIKDTEALAMAVASFFFALWSIRGIFAADIKTFPTLLDSAVLTLSVLMVIALLFKISFRVASKVTKANSE